MSKPTKKSIGSRIKEARKRAGMSRRALMMKMRGEGADVTEATIFNWESGSTIPTADRLFVLAKALGLSPQFFWS